MFARVIDGTVTEVMASLPENTESVSGFNLLPTSEQIKRGYYPLTEVKPAIDPDTERLEEVPTYIIGPVSVTATYVKVAKLAAELAAELDAAKLAAAVAIDEQAGATRRKYITDVSGQSETYLAKANDAEAYKTAGYPVANITSYPMVRAEGRAMYGAAPTSTEYEAAADYILATRAQWIPPAAVIEENRRFGKIAVSRSQSVAEAVAAKDLAVSILAAL